MSRNQPRLLAIRTLNGRPRSHRALTLSESVKFDTDDQLLCERCGGQITAKRTDDNKIKIRHAEADFSCRWFHLDRDWSPTFPIVPNVLADFYHPAFEDDIDRMTKELVQLGAWRREDRVNQILAADSLADLVYCYMSLPQHLHDEPFFLPMSKATTLGRLFVDLGNQWNLASVNDRRVYFGTAVDAAFDHCLTFEVARPRGSARRRFIKIEIDPDDTQSVAYVDFIANSAMRPGSIIYALGHDSRRWEHADHVIVAPSHAYIHINNYNP